MDDQTTTEPSGLKFGDFVKGDKLYIKDCYVNNQDGVYLGIAETDIYLNQWGRKTVQMSDTENTQEKLEANCLEYAEKEVTIESMNPDGSEV